MEHQLSAVLRFLRERHRLVRQGGDRGTTLVEVVAGMTIMMVCGAIFTGAVVTLHTVTNRAQAITNSATQNNQVYQSLDKTVRYAAAITTPGLGAGVGSARSWYVEMRDTTSGVEVCTQLRLHTESQQLQRRTWSPSTLVTPPKFVPIASGITNGTATAGSADQPFVVAVSSPTATHQQLTVTTVAASGPASSPVSSRSSVGFTALNSTVPPATGSICQQAGRP